MEIPEITVSVEKAVHDSLRKLAQTIWDEHGICVRDVRFEWIVADGMSAPHVALTKIDVSTTTIR